MYRISILAGMAFLMTGCSPPAVSIPEAGKLPILESGMHRKSISVPEVGNVNCAIRVDDSYDHSTPAPLVLVLHYGYQGSKPESFTGADMLEAFIGAVGEIGGIAIAPDAVGGDWKSASNERSTIWLVNSVMNSYNINTDQVYVTGFSMGGEGTWYLAGRHQDLFTGAIAVAAPVTGIKQWTIPAYSIHSNQDKVVSYSAAKKYAESIEAAGGTIKFKTVRGLDHFDTSRYGPYVTEGVKWLRMQ